MSVLDELRAAAHEMAVRERISQARWVDALVDGWLRDTTMAWVIARAGGLPGGVILTDSDWERMRAAAEKLKPSFSAYGSARTRVHIWIANHAKRANDALWDGRIEDAKRLLPLGGRQEDGRLKNRREAIKEINRTSRNRKFVSARAADKRSDWGVVK